MTKRRKIGTAEPVEDFRVDTFLEAIGNVFRTYGLVLITPRSDDPIVHTLRPVDVGWLQDAAIGADVGLAEPVQVGSGLKGAVTAHVG